MPRNLILNDIERDFINENENRFFFVQGLSDKINLSVWLYNHGWIRKLNYFKLNILKFVNKLFSGFLKFLGFGKHNINIISKKFKSLYINLTQEISEAKVEAKTKTFVKRLPSILVSGIGSLSASFALFSMLTIIASNERGYWGAVGGEIFAAITIIFFVYRLIRILSE